MKTFLSIVAQDLLEHYGTDMRHVTVVFPSKRAGLFLSQELLSLSTKPVWAPRYITMGELFRQHTTRLLADPIDCICRLYALYIKYVGEEIRTDEGDAALQHESLDRFWGWGEVLMADFDDIDKHLADARQVFRHIHDLAELQDLSFLDEEQKRILARFFGYFSADENSIIRQRFIRLWDKMSDIYTELKQQLASENMLWEGALYREVCESVMQQGLAHKDGHQICFVGFNVLNSVEEELMKAYAPHARFYWDYDVYYTDDPSHEAGEFMRRNLRLFPSALPASHFRNLERLKEITYISCTTDNAAARYTRQWLGGNLNADERMNAVVLCNEQLMLPVLHSIPDTAEQGMPEKINVTMGFPLSETPVYSFVNALLSLQTDGWDERHSRFRYAFTQQVLHHPYARFADKEQLVSCRATTQTELLGYVRAMLETVGKAYGTIASPDIYEQLYIESVFQAHRIILKFIQMLQHPDALFNVHPNTLRRLIRNVLSSTSIPFHGEPATGLQIMGVLETRCLDFSNLLMLSVEEDKLPRNTQQNSLIPPVVREVYGLTTPRHKISIFAYYFYRLIQRAEHLTCVFNENCVGIEHHEISRFLRQLMAERSPEQLHIHKFSIENKPLYSAPLMFQIEKTPDILKAMYGKYGMEHSKQPHYLSPTAINSYCRCPMQFYYRYVEGLRPADEETDEIDPSVFGNIFHDASEILYTDVMLRHGGSRVILKEWLLPYLQKDNRFLRQYIDLSFDLNVFHPFADEEEKDRRIRECLDTRKVPQNTYVGQAIIVRDVLVRYLYNLVRCDCRLAPITIHGLETQCMTTLPIQANGQTLTIRTGGRIDRLDELADQTLRVFDYKTGTPHSFSGDISALFVRGDLHPDYVFQTCLYALALKRSPQWSGQGAISPALFFVRESYNENYDPRIFVKVLDESGKAAKTANFCDFMEDFKQELDTLLKEIFTAEVPFTQTSDKKVCEKCDFCLLCNRLKTRKDN